MLYSRGTASRKPQVCIHHEGRELDLCKETAMLDELDNFEKPVYTLRLWSYAEAVDALPYLCAVTRALRDDWVSMHQARRVRQQALASSRRPNRDDLVRR